MLTAVTDAEKAMQERILAVDDWLVLLLWWLAHHVIVGGVSVNLLGHVSTNIRLKVGLLSVHDNVDEKDLKSV